MAQVRLRALKALEDSTRPEVDAGEEEGDLDMSVASGAAEADDDGAAAALWQALLANADFRACCRESGATQIRGGCSACLANMPAAVFCALGPEELGFVLGELQQAGARY